MTMVQYSRVQDCIVQYSLVQASLVKYSIVQQSRVQSSKVQYSIVQQSRVQCSIVQAGSVRDKTDGPRKYVSSPAAFGALRAAYPMAVGDGLFSILQLCYRTIVAMCSNIILQMYCMLQYSYITCMLHHSIQDKSAQTSATENQKSPMVCLTATAAIEAVSGVLRLPEFVRGTPWGTPWATSFESGCSVGSAESSRISHLEVCHRRCGMAGVSFSTLRLGRFVCQKRA